VSPLAELLDAARGARWLGHLAGLLAYALLAFCGLGGPLAWGAVLFLAPALLLVELGWGLADGPTRRLRALSRGVLLQSLPEAERAELQSGLLGLPRRALWRAALVWLLASLGTLLVGVSWRGALLLVCAGAPLSALLQVLILGLRLRRVLAYFELGTDPSEFLKPWLAPLGQRLRWSVLAPGLVALAPLAALVGLGQAVDPLVLGGAALLGLAAAVASVAALRSSMEEPLQELRDALKGLAQGQSGATLAVGDGGLLGSLMQEGRRALKAQELRDQQWQRYGRPLVGGLPAQDPVAMRPVAVLVLRWFRVTEGLAPLAPAARLALLRRLATATQKALDAHGAWILEATAERWVAVWGAPQADAKPVQKALAAAWELQALLPVLQQQLRLRDQVALEFGLALASGQAACGLGGPQGRDRYSVQGGPLDEALRLAELGGGAWIDERSAAAAQAPFAAHVLAQGLRLSAGPSMDVGPGLTLGFTPGDRL
jgi:adenylate cyclase